MNTCSLQRHSGRVVAAALAVLAVLAASLFWVHGPHEFLFDKAWWARQPQRWMAWRDEAPVVFVLGFMLLFTLLSALALPGCAALTLLAGTAFGTVAGTLLVGLASTFGATLSFLVARHWARQGVQRQPGQRLAAVDAAIVRHGRLGLFWLRLLPVVPFPVLNPLLGLSRLSLPAFFWPSLAGLTLGSVPYVWLGGSLLTLWQEGELNLWTLVGATLLMAATLALTRQRQRRASAMAENAS